MRASSAACWSHECREQSLQSSFIKTQIWKSKSECRTSQHKHDALPQVPGHVRRYKETFFFYVFLYLPWTLRITNLHFSHWLYFVLPFRISLLPPRVFLLFRSSSLRHSSRQVPQLAGIYLGYFFLSYTTRSYIYHSSIEHTVNSEILKGRCLATRAPTRTRTHRHTHTHARTQPHTHTRIHAQTQTHTQIHRHARARHTHTHTQSTSRFYSSECEVTWNKLQRLEYARTAIVVTEEDK